MSERGDGGNDGTSAVNHTQRLLDAIAARVPGAPEALLAEHPDAALGYGAGGESPLLVAAYHRQDALVRQLASTRPLDAFEAAALGDVERLRALVDTEPPLLAARSWDGWTPLHLAAFFGRAEAAVLLLDQGADSEAPSNNAMTNTPLCAALAGAVDEETVRALVERAANVRARAANGVTPLHLAASRGADGPVRLLLEHGADPAAAMDDGTTPAEIARQRGQLATAELIETWISP